MKSILSILVIAVSIGVYFVYIKPMTVEIKINLAKKAEIEKVLNRVDEIKDKRDEVFSDYNSISETDLEKLKKILPEKINSVEIFNDLSVVALEYGLLVTEFKADENVSDRNAVDETTTNAPYKKTKITFKIKGTYTEFTSFLKKVESSLRLMDIIFLSIKPGSGESVNIPLEYLIEANIYSLK
jgi:Tfp pilus assembly protein PilO